MVDSVNHARGLVSKQRVINLFLGGCLWLLLSPTQAALVACEAVANQAGGYLPLSDVLASKQSLNQSTPSWDGEAIGTIGSWTLYQTQQFALDRNDCKPQYHTIQTETAEAQSVLFYPVLKNQRQNRWAIFTGQFVVIASTALEDFSDQGWELRPSVSSDSLDSHRYTFQFNALHAPTASYDEAVAVLHRHPQIRQFTPIFIEQRYHLR